MAQWRERRGLTLRLRVSGGRARYVRLTLVEREALGLGLSQGLSRLMGGWFNVQEARAEGRATPDATQALPQALGPGRMLSWRPMAHEDAVDAMQRRRRTLERLGYVVIAASEHSAEPWAWIRDLVHRQLRARAGETTQSSEAQLWPEDDATASESRSDPDAPTATDAARPDTGVHPLLDAALAGVGGDVSALLEGFARTLEIETEQLETPTPKVLATLDPDALGEILDALAEAESPRLRACFRAWMDLPTTAYELDAERLEGWLEQGRLPAQRLAGRLPSEGLALLGPASLERLARRSRSPRVRAFCQGWARRFG